MLKHSERPVSQSVRCGTQEAPPNMPAHPNITKPNGASVLLVFEVTVQGGSKVLYAQNNGVELHVESVRAYDVGDIQSPAPCKTAPK
jgi:hypothetical protein